MTDPTTLADVLNAEGDTLARAIVDRHYDEVPSLAQRYGAAGRAKCLVDAKHHLSYLKESIASGEPELFIEYVRWGHTVLAERGIPTDDLIVNLDCMKAVIAARYGGQCPTPIATQLDDAVAALRSAPMAYPSFLSDDAPHGVLAGRYLERMLARDRAAATKLVMDAVDDGTPIRDAYEHIFEPVQHEIGRLWQLNASRSPRSISAPPSRNSSSRCSTRACSSSHRRTSAWSQRASAGTSTRSVCEWSPTSSRWTDGTRSTSALTRHRAMS